MTQGSATVPDRLHPLHRHDVGACELPLPRELEPVAFAMRHLRACKQAKAKARLGQRLAVALHWIATVSSSPLTFTDAASVDHRVGEALDDLALLVRREDGTNMSSWWLDWLAACSGRRRD